MVIFSQVYWWRHAFHNMSKRVLSWYYQTRKINGIYSYMTHARDKG